MLVLPPRLLLLLVTVAVVEFVIVVICLLLLVIVIVDVEAVAAPLHLLQDTCGGEPLVVIRKALAAVVVPFPTTAADVFSNSS